jgi:outer membrane receptor protein involved in Fe transport
MDLNVRGGAAQITGVSMCRVNSRIRLFSTSIFLATAFCCAGAYAQTLVHFDLPSQPLARSLTAIGTATNTNVGFSASQVAGLLAPPLKADLTVDGALMRVLAGTGLRPRHLDDHTILIGGADVSASGSADMKLALAKASASGGQLAEDPHAGNAADVSSPPILDQTDTSVRDSGKNTEGKSIRDSGAQIEEIVVTGSHIRGIDNKTNSLVVIDQTQIEQSGYSSTQDLFFSLPQNYAGGSTTQAGFIGAGQLNGDFSSAINLRGLGASSTLVLLNGHRMSPAVQGTQVDVSSIPLSAIERIEILTDGASAIYGSDAVGGVVNIITKKDYDGADTSARFGSVTSGSRREETIAQTLGKSWASGNVTGTFQYQGHSRLDSRDRDFTADVPSPTDLLPAEHSYSGMLTGRQILSDSVEVYTDVLWSKREFDQSDTSDLGVGVGDAFGKNFGNANNLNVAAGVKYDFLPKWSVELNVLYARQNTEQSEPASGPGILASYGETSIDTFQAQSFDEKSIDLLLNGKLVQTSAGDVGIAVGASYRDEDASIHSYFNGASNASAGLDRTVRAYYGELYVPIVGDQNSKPLLHALAISAAIRGDRYSDFGSTTNPRVGLLWSPLSSVSVRGSYGTSFRAPTEYEISQTTSTFIGIIPLQSPTGPGLVPVIESTGTSPLAAEKATTIDFGVEYRPVSLEGLDLRLNYYDIRYKDRIIQVFPPANALTAPNVYGQLITRLPSDAAAQAYLDNAINSGAIFFGNQAGTMGTTGVRYAFDIGLHNASIVRQSGLDFIGNLTTKFSAGNLSTQLNATFADKIDTAYSSGAGFANLVGTYGNPPKWRLRALEAWTTTRWEVNAAISAVGSYVNTAALGSPPVSSWTTVDLGARVHVDRYFSGSGWKGVTVGLSALNVLNRDPPYISAISITSQPIHFDPTNASPLARFVSIELRKRW